MGGVIGGGLHQSRNPCDAGEPSGAIKKKKNKKSRKSSSVQYSDPDTLSENAKYGQTRLAIDLKIGTHIP